MSDRGDTSYEIHGLAYGPEGGYIERTYTIDGPLYHGGRSKRLTTGSEIRTGMKTNPWGDEGAKSQFVHFTTRLETAQLYADQAGGSVYEVEPTGEIRFGCGGDEYKSDAPLRVVRKVQTG